MNKVEELLSMIAEEDFVPEIHTEQDEALQRFDEEDAYRT